LLFALGRPVAFAGLLLGFALALALRAFAVRLVLHRLRFTREPITPRVREDVDPFGAVAAAVGGVRAQEHRRRRAAGLLLLPAQLPVAAPAVGSDRDGLSEVVGVAPT
jgi:hypothetical protein